MADNSNISRNNSSRIKGFNYQGVAGLYLFLKNIKNLNSMNIEGKEDIILNWEDGRASYLQAKETLKPYDTYNAGNVKKAMVTLTEDIEKYGDKVKEVILVTNSHYLLGKSAGNIFDRAYGRYDYNDLPESVQSLLKEKGDIDEDKIDLGKLSIVVIDYYGSDDDTKLSELKNGINEFMQEVGIGNSSSRRFLEQWLFMVNRSTEEEAMIISKQVLVGNIIVVLIDSVEMLDTFFNDFEIDPGNEGYITSEFEDYLLQISMDISIVNRIHKIKLEYGKGHPKERRIDRIRGIVEACCNQICPYLGLDKNTPKDLDIAKFIAWMVVRNETKIQQVEEGVNL